MSSNPKPMYTVMTGKHTTCSSIFETEHDNLLNQSRCESLHFNCAMPLLEPQYVGSSLIYLFTNHVRFHLHLRYLWNHPPIKPKGCNKSGTTIVGEV
jgi:hypothetical protein